MQQVAPASDRPFCNKAQQQTGSICVSSTGPPCLDSRCTQPAMGGSGTICRPTSSHLGQSGGEVAGLPMQEYHSDCSRVAQHALVLESRGYVQPDLTVPAQKPTQESVKPKSACLAPHASAIKEQGFSEAVGAQIEAPQRGSTRSVYEAKWIIFLQSGASVIRWTSGHPL